MAKSNPGLVPAIGACLLAGALAGGLCTAYYLREASLIEKDLRFRETTRVEMRGRLLAEELQNAVNDLRILSTGDGLRAYVESGAAADLKRLTERAVFFTTLNSNYDQIRYINQSGREVMRVDRKGQVVPEAELQDKSDRPYFFNARDIAPGQIYVSVFDLNTEKGRIEDPPRPMLRFSTPILDASGKRQGVYVINYQGANIIERLRQASTQYQNRLRILNARGYWIRAGKPSQEWGFMYPDRAGLTLAQIDPPLWTEITNRPSGQIRQQGGMFTWYRVTPMESIKGKVNVVSEEPFFVVASRVSIEDWDSMFANLRITATAVGIVLFLLTTISGWLFHQRRQTVAELRQNQTLLQTILDNTPAIIYLKDQAGRYLFINHRFEQVTGFTRAQVQGKTATELFPPEIATAADQHHTSLLKSKEPLEFEETVNYPDGPHTHLAVKFPLRDASGRVYATGGISTDISERKRAEQVHLQFRALFECLPGLYLVLTPDLKIVAVSDAYLKATMTAREAILGKGLFEVFPDNPDDLKATGVSNLSASLSRVKQNLVSDTMAIQKYDVRRPDGTFEERFWSPVNSPVLGVDRRLEYIIHRVEDVTEFVRQKQGNSAKPDQGMLARLEQMEAEIYRSSQQVQAANEQLYAANRELEAFSYSVSHDLRAPLRHIDGFLDLLAKNAGDKLDERGQRYVKIIGDAAKQMGNLIDDLLVFSRMGRSEMHRQMVDMNVMVEQVIGGLQPELAGRQIKWKIAHLPEVVADGPMLRQVWVNLIGNAVKYTRTRTSAEIEIGSKEEPPGQIVFYVRDNGVGFDMQYVEKLFGVFQRLHRSDEFEGTGIGLANVRRIVHRHGGTTWAEGTVDKGATFYYTLEQQHVTNNH